MASPRPRLRATGATTARLVVLALAVAAIAVAAVDRADSPPEAAAPVRVGFVYSPDLNELLVPLIRRFNASGVTVRDRSVRIVGQRLSSGEAERQIAAGELEPVVWAPATSLWGRLLNAHVRRTWVSVDSPLLGVVSPQVIAIPEQRARRLGWPDRAIGWGDIPTLVAEGRVRFAHPSPLTSTSGLSALAAEYYAVTGKIGGLTIEDVHRARGQVRRIEQAVVHYAYTADDFLDQLTHYGADHASAVVVQETSLVQFNEDEKAPWRLVAVYPEDGTFVADYPYVIMAAPWVGAVEREAAQLFLDWLRGEITPERAARSGYRVASPGEPVLPPVDPEHGADPDEPDVLLRPPAPDVLTAIVGAWEADRKLADIVLAVDASMLAGGKAIELRLAVERLLAPLTQRHRVGLIVFGDTVSTVVPVGPLAANAQALRSGVARRGAATEAALYDAIATAVRQAAATSDRARTKAVVVITDGRDGASSIDLGALGAQIRGSGVHVFAVAYGRGADRKALETVAATSQGNAVPALPGQLADVLREIAHFF